MVNKKRSKRNESNYVKKDEDLNETKVNVEENFFYPISNRTTIDCNQFDIKIFKNVCFFGISNKNETKQSFFERGRKETKCSITKKTKRLDP